MKKKNVLASLLLAGAMFLTACGGSASSTSAASGVSGSFTGTAKGMVFLTLEDEAGLANVIVVVSLFGQLTLLFALAYWGIYPSLL